MLMLVLIPTVLILWVWSRRNINKDDPPIASGSKILIGHTLNFTGDSIKLWESVKHFSKEALQRGGVLKTTVGPRVIYVVSDPEDYSTVSRTCLQKDAIYNFAKSWLGSGLVTADSSKWIIHRKLLNPAFSQHVLDNFMGVFNRQSRGLVNKLKVEVGKGPFDFWTYTKQNALETICSTALGMNFEKESAINFEYFRAISNVLNILITRFQKFWLHNNLLFSLSSLKKKQEQCIKVFHNMSNAILEERKKNLNNSISDVEDVKETTKGKSVIPIHKDKGHKFKSFMDLLLEISSNSNVFTYREIREHVNTIIVTGHDTTATTVMFCTLLVGSHPLVQEKIHNELKNVFGDDDRDVTKQDLTQLVYLEAVIKETMRIYPVVPVVGRHVDKDIKLRNCTLSPGNSVFLSIYGVYRHSMFGTNVEEFRPERWLESVDIALNPYGLSSFGIGRRTCIGKTFAMMSMKVTLAHIYRSYKVHGDPTRLKLKLDVMLRPASGCDIAIENRN